MAKYGAQWGLYLLAVMVISVSGYTAADPKVPEPTAAQNYMLVEEPAVSLSALDDHIGYDATEHHYQARKKVLLQLIDSRSQGTGNRVNP